MRPKIIRLFPLLAALALCGCQNLTSRTPVGDAVPPLDPKIWNGKWQYVGNPMVATTSIGDAKRGLVDIKMFTPWTNPKNDIVETYHVMVRKLGAETIENNFDDTPASGYGFERVVASGDVIITFAPDQGVFEKLIKQHRIAGKIEKDQNGKRTGNCTIEGLSGRDYGRLEKEGVDVRSLFEENPTRVFVRTHALW